MRKEERNAMFMLLSPSGPATINVEGSAGYITGCGRGQKQKRARDFLRFPQTSQHGARCQLSSQRRRRPCGKRSRRDRVDPDSPLPQLGGQMAGELQQRRLGGAVMKRTLTVPRLVEPAIGRGQPV